VTGIGRGKEIKIEIETGIGIGIDTGTGTGIGTVGLEIGIEIEIEIVEGVEEIFEDSEMAAGIESVLAEKMCSTETADLVVDPRIISIAIGDLNQMTEIYCMLPPALEKCKLRRIQSQRHLFPK
jgi:hypothetical protein